MSPKCFLYNGSLLWSCSLSVSSNKLIALHGSGVLVTIGPPAPLTPNLEIMMSNEVDTYLCAVKAETADGVAALWRPGPASGSASSRSPSMARGTRGTAESSRGKEAAANMVGWPSRLPRTCTDSRVQQCTLSSLLR